jgi:soluble cytochrome b562
VKKFSMLLTLALTLSLSLVSELSAQDVSPLSLKNNKKQSGIILKQISATINDASKNQENAASITKMIGFFQAARSQSPDSVTNGSFADYQALIDQEIQNFKDLQDAFQKNDNVAALSIVQKLNNVKKEGHDKYK